MSPILVRPGDKVAFQNLRADQYPCSMLVYYLDDEDLMIVWAVTLLAPEGGAKAIVQVPPAASWIGRRVEAAVIPAREPWPENLKLVEL